MICQNYENIFRKILIGKLGKYLQYISRNFQIYLSKILSMPQISDIFLCSNFENIVEKLTEQIFHKIFQI